MNTYRLNIITDTDPTIGYETNGWAKRFFNRIFIPFLNTLPSSLRELIKRTNHSAKKVIERATTHEAIEVLYNHGEPERAKTFLDIQ